MKFKRTSIFIAFSAFSLLAAPLCPALPTGPDHHRCFHYLLSINKPSNNGSPPDHTRVLVTCLYSPVTKELLHMEETPVGNVSLWKEIAREVGERLRGDYPEIHVWD